MEPVTTAALISAGGSLLGGLGGKQGSKGAAKAQRKSQEYARHLATPQGAKDWIGQMNPGFYGAFYDQQPGNTGYQQSLYNLMMNPGESSNWPYTQGMQGINNSFTAAQGKLGRSAMSGGLSQAYGLANEAHKNQLGQQYGFMRDQRMRDDLDFITRLLQGNIGMAQGGAAQAGYMGNMQGVFQPNWMTTAAKGIGAGLAAYGSLGGFQPETQMSQYGPYAPGQGGYAFPPSTAINSGSLFSGPIYQNQPQPGQGAGYGVLQSGQPPAATTPAATNTFTPGWPR